MFYQSCYAQPQGQAVHFFVTGLKAGQGSER